MVRRNAQATTHGAIQDLRDVVQKARSGRMKMTHVAQTYRVGGEGRERARHREYRSGGKPSKYTFEDRKTCRLVITIRVLSRHAAHKEPEANPATVMNTPGREVVDVGSSRSSDNGRCHGRRGGTSMQL